MWLERVQLCAVGQRYMMAPAGNVVLSICTTMACGCFRIHAAATGSLCQVL